MISWITAQGYFLICDSLGAGRTRADVDMLGLVELAAVYMQVFSSCLQSGVIESLRDEQQTPVIHVMRGDEVTVFPLGPAFVGAYIRHQHRIDLYLHKLGVVADSTSLNYAAHVRGSLLAVPTRRPGYVMTGVLNP